MKSSPLGLEPLFTALRAEGFRVAFDEIVRLHHVFSLSPDLNLEQLRQVLCSIIVKTASEQAKFNRTFDHWIAQSEQLSLSQQQETARLSPPEQHHSLSPPKRRTRGFAWVTIAIVGIFPLIGLVWGLQVAPFANTVDTSASTAAPNISASVLGTASASVNPPVPAGDGSTTTAGSTPLPAALPSRPQVFQVYVPKVTVTPPSQLPLGFALGGLLVGVVLFLFRGRKPSLHAPKPSLPTQPGPTAILVKSPVHRGPQLLSARDEEALSWGIGRFISEEKTDQLDLDRTVTASAQSGGIPELRFHLAKHTREVWIWVDDSADDPTMVRFADEMTAAMTQAGLPVERASFWGVPEHLRRQDGSRFAPTEVDERKDAALVAILTDGRMLQKHYGAEPRTRIVQQLLRGLSNWPRLGFVDFAGGNHDLDGLLLPYGIPVLLPERLIGFLSSGAIPHEGAFGQQPVDESHIALHGELRAWAAACALSLDPIDEQTAFALRRHLGLKTSPWAIRDLRAMAPGPADKLAFSKHLRTQLLRWLKDSEQLNPDGTIPETTWLGRALQFWDDTYDAEHRRRSAVPPRVVQDHDIYRAESVPPSPARERGVRGVRSWIGTLAERHWRVHWALVKLWSHPNEAASLLYGLFDGEVAKAIEGQLAWIAAADMAAPEDVVVMPWRLQDRPAQVKAMLLQMGFGKECHVVARKVLKRPRWLWAALGLCAVTSLGGMAVYLWQMQKEPWISQGQIGPPRKSKLTQTGWAEWQFVVESVHFSEEQRVSGGSHISVSWELEKRPCTENLADGAEIWRCGTMANPKRPQGTEEWPWPDRSVAVILRPDPLLKIKSLDVKSMTDTISSSMGTELANRLLVTGSADVVVVVDTKALDARNAQTSLNHLCQATQQLWDATKDQLLLFVPKSGLGFEVLPDQLSTLCPANLKTASTVIVKVDQWEDLISGFDFKGVRRVDEVWPKAAVMAADGSPIRARIAGDGPCPDGMAFIPGGTFQMGSDDGDSDEKPVHPVTLPDFCLDKTEVTVAAYELFACVPGGECDPAPTTVQWSVYSDAQVKFWSQFCNANKADRQDHPINCVDWSQADTYCKKQGKRLPTEEEWEYAARGGNEQRKYPWGDEAPGPTLLNACGDECVEAMKKRGLDWSAMVSGSDGYPETAPVGLFPKDESKRKWGLTDMAGNVWEWTESWYCGDYGKNCANSDSRVVRGGSWSSLDPSAVRASNRYNFTPTDRDDDVGFRCARTVR